MLTRAPSRHIDCIITHVYTFFNGGVCVGPHDVYVFKRFCALGSEDCEVVCGISLIQILILRFALKKLFWTICMENETVLTTDNFLF